MTAVRTAADAGYPASFYQAMGQRDDYVHVRLVDAMLDLIQPDSVVDVGCGVGAFLSCFKSRGVGTVLGVDLPGLRPQVLRIATDEYWPHDLRQPLTMARRFDLVLSLETAEHLPATCADDFVDSLTHLGDVVVFSAAVPFQEGFRHINLQWQDYWAAKFSARGYVAVDALRGPLWHDKRVPFYYKQNALVYVLEESLSRYPALEAAHARTDRNSLSRVHPDFFLAKADPRRATLRTIVTTLPRLPRALMQATRQRLKS